MPLKRNGEVCKYTVPDFIGKLTPAEFDAYNDAFGAIQDEFGSLEQIKDNLKEITDNPGIFQIPDSHFAGQSVVVPNTQSGESRLNVCSCLLKLNRSDIVLCERETSEGKQFAVVERYQNDSPYAQANGNARVLAVSHDALQAVEDYVANAEHTLRFMASNMVARAQTIVWERFANQSPARVIRAISERCAKAVGDVHNEIQARILEQRMARRTLQRQATGYGV
ncbi:MAG: hypothetical protein ACREDS_16670 [Limisphaerales bacterium]